MILADVNVLVYAFDNDSRRHAEYRRWLDEVLAGPEDFALLDTVLSGFVRIVTHPRIMPRPAPAAIAIEFVQGLVSAPRSRWLTGTADTWQALAQFAANDEQIRANHVPDAFIAASAMAHGARVATADRGFARYNVAHFDPVA